LINQYRRPDGALMQHLDTYRLADAHEALELDLDELLEQGILLIEWADRIQDLLPAEALWIHMKLIGDEQRQMRFEPHGVRYEQITTEIRRLIFGAA
jgi:tRNA threonylcarbamoyladenosine biosynthesis protein TsaE